MWRKGFENLENMEQDVLTGKLSKKVYAKMIINFNRILKPLNQEASEHNLISFTEYWVHNIPLRRDVERIIKAMQHETV